MGSAIPAMLCCALLLCAPASAAEGGALERNRDVADAGDCELEASIERSRARGETAQTQTALRGACGVGWRTELALGLARERAGAQREHKLELQAQHTLRERGDDGGIGWTIGAGVGLDRQGGGGWRRSEYQVELEATRELGPGWIVEVKLGSLRDRAARRDSTLWGMGLEHTPNEQFEWRVELSGDDRSRPFAGIGLRHTLGLEDLQFKLAFETRLGTPRERRLAFAVQVDF